MQSIDISLLEHGLRQCFVDQNKYIKKNVAVVFETLCSSVDKDTSPDDQENFHEFLKSVTNAFTQNVYTSKDNTYNLLKSLKPNKNIVFPSGNKNSSVVILDTACLKKKLIH